MYKNLNPASLALSGRQSELIELALTYGFRGLTVDMDEMFKRAKNQGMEASVRFIESAKVMLRRLNRDSEFQVGDFQLPIRLHVADEHFESDMAKMEGIGNLATALGAQRCSLAIRPSSDRLSFQENFERQRDRLNRLAEVLQPLNLTLGLELLAAKKRRPDGEYQFIHKAEELLTLIKTVNSPHVGLTLDTWNWHVGGGSFDQLSELPVAQLVSVRLANVPATADPATVEETERLFPESSGLLDFTALLKRLLELEYEGPVSINPHPRQLRGMTRDAIVQKTSDLLDSLFASVGLGKPPAVVAIADDAPAEEDAAEGDAEAEAGESEATDAATSS